MRKRDLHVTFLAFAPSHDLDTCGICIPCPNLAARRPGLPTLEGKRGSGQEDARMMIITIESRAVNGEGFILEPEHFSLTGGTCLKHYTVNHCDRGGAQSLNLGI